MAEVKQVDRDVAADYIIAAYPEATRDARVSSMRQGGRDNDRLIQAFAAHREAAEKAEREACAKVADDLYGNVSASMAGVKVKGSKAEAACKGNLAAAKHIATAIRARGDGGGAMDELIARDADLI